jgi:hypothetical protein
MIDTATVFGLRMFPSLTFNIMSLVPKSSAFYLPSYSLTSDVLGFIRCGLQYRYQGVAKIPSTRPFQLWFGEFIHGVMEEGYREYQKSVSNGAVDLPPWNPVRVYRMGRRIEQSLKDRKLFPNNKNVRKLGYLRAVTAINELGPYLFPLISEAEISLSATRSMMAIPSQYQTRHVSSYEMTGRVDVITSVQLNDPAHRNNTLVQYLVGFLNQERAQGRLQHLPADFEVIIDYKGARRPAISTAGGGATDYWSVYGWQVKTYAHIREMQSDSQTVALGVVIYLNELLPTWGDLAKMRSDIANQVTDITPTPGSDDWDIIHMRKPRKSHPDHKKNRELSWDFRMRRALRLEPVHPAAVDEAVSRFDRYVRQIEISHSKERLCGDILNSWPKNISDPDTCAACDYQTFCTSYKGGPSVPRLPSL